MNQRKHSILFLLFTVGLFAGVLLCTETTHAKVKVTVKNGVCTVSGKGAMTKPKSYNQKIKKVVIQNGVTSLPVEAFAGCRKLKKVSIANSVKSIGACAFMQTDLREITIPNSVKKLGNSVLSSCKKLTKIKMPGNVKITYGSDQYYPVFQFDVDSPVKTIELTSSLNLEIFMYLSTENIVVSKKDPKYTAIDGLLYTKDGKSLVRIPNLRKKAVIADGCEEFCTTAVEWAGDDDGDPYMGCQNLKTITLPESIQTINTKKHLTRWGTSSYAEDHSPDKTDSISFTIANKNMPWEQVSLLHNKFNTPYEMLRKEVPGAFGPGFEQGFITAKDGTLLIKYVGKDKSVILPAYITEIGKNAFADAALSEITIPKSVTTIDSGAFSDCKKLAKVIFEGTPSDISPDAFTERSVLIEPGSIESQYTWAVPDITKSTRKGYTISFCCLPLEGADGYELQVSSSKKYASKKTKTFTMKKTGKLVCKFNTNSGVIYSRVRPYTLTTGVKVYGKWTCRTIYDIVLNDD